MEEGQQTAVGLGTQKRLRGPPEPTWDHQTGTLMRKVLNTIGNRNYGISHNPGHDCFQGCLLLLLTPQQLPKAVAKGWPYPGAPGQFLNYGGRGH